MQQTTRVSRRRWRGAGLALLAVTSLSLWTGPAWAEKAGLSDLRADGNMAAMRQKAVSELEQLLLQDIPIEPRPGRTAVVYEEEDDDDTYSGAAYLAASQQKYVSTQEQAMLQNIRIEPRPDRTSGTQSSAAAEAQDGGPQVPLSSAQDSLAATTDEETTTSRRKVQLEAHIMSKCPDARDCLAQLVVPTMERAAGKVELTLGFIGKADEGGDESRLSCKHGPSECLGNMLMLCAVQQQPERPVVWLGFANCLTEDYGRIPERSLVEGCALEHAVDFEALNACVSDSGDGEELLRHSMRWSSDRGVTYSCTVRLADETWCIRDDGAWRDCPGGSSVDDLVAAIDRLAVQES